MNRFGEQAAGNGAKAEDRRARAGVRECGRGYHADGGEGIMVSETMDSGKPMWNSVLSRRTPSSPATGAMGRRAILGSLAGGVFGSMAWLVALGVMARDWVTVGVAAAGAVMVSMVGAMGAVRFPRGYFRVAAGAAAAVGAVEVLVLNVRWPALKAVAEMHAFAGQSQPTPLWVWNAVLILVFGMVTAVLLVRGATARP